MITFCIALIVYLHLILVLYYMLYVARDISNTKRVHKLELSCILIMPIMKLRYSETLKVNGPIDVASHCLIDMRDAISLINSSLFTQIFDSGFKVSILFQIGWKSLIIDLFVIMINIICSSLCREHLLDL